MPAPPVYSFGDQALGAIMSLVALLPWMRKRRKESELAEQQKAQSLKAQGR
jgi:hypothetical protein